MTDKQLEFESVGDHQEATYRGIVIKAITDEHPSNPFEEWDCEPPIVVHYDRGLKCYDEITPQSPELNSKQIKDNLTKLKEALDFTKDDTLLKFCSDYAGSSRNSYGVDMVELLNDAITNYHEQLSLADSLYLTADLYTIKGIPAEVHTTTGYSQGHQADVLVVLTDEWYEMTGAPKDHDTSEVIKQTVDLYGAWAWGDVYGYDIQYSGGDDEGESCWGYYGTDFNKSGLADAAVENINYYLNQLVKVTRVHCGDCGSQNVNQDAVTQWDVKLQKDVLKDVHESGYCDCCDDNEISIEVVVCEQARSSTL